MVEARQAKILLMRTGNSVSPMMHERIEVVAIWLENEGLGTCSGYSYNTFVDTLAMFCNHQD